MAVDLHTGDTAFSSKLDKNDDDDDDDVHSVSGSDKNNNMEDDFIAELTHQMAHFTLQDEEDTLDLDFDFNLDFSGIGSPTQNFEPAWDLTSSPQSTLWSPEGSSSTHSQEPSPPATPNDSTTYDMNDVEFRSHQTLIQEQIRAIELSRLKQEHVLSPNVPCRKGKEEIQKKGNGNGGRSRPPRPTPLQTGTSMRALFLGGRCGTGVFLPRAATTCAPSESTTSNNKQGKGCSVLIPARVMQALQLHFDKTAAMSAPKVVAFPPLRDLIVSGGDGMQNKQTAKAPADIQHEMILPREWTY